MPHAATAAAAICVEPSTASVAFSARGSPAIDPLHCTPGSYTMMIGATLCVEGFFLTLYCWYGLTKLEMWKMGSFGGKTINWEMIEFIAQATLWCVAAWC